MPSSSWCGLRGLERVPAHVRDLQRRVARRDPVDLAGDPAEPVGDLVFAAALGHELHADADAEKRPALAAHGFLQRLDHARHRVEAAPAIGERADARQHHAIGLAHRVGIAGHHDRLARARSRAPRARTPWPPNADCRSRNRRWRRSWTHAHGRFCYRGGDCGSGNRPMTGGGSAAERYGIAPAGAAHRTRFARIQASKKRRSADSSSSRHHDAVIDPAAPRQGPAPQRRRLRSRPAARPAHRPMNFTGAEAPSAHSPTCSSVIATT